MVNFFASNENLLVDDQVHFLLPVIFTTADLWVTAADLGSADIVTGRLASELSVEKVEWLPFQYHLSPGVKHQLRPPNRNRSIGGILDDEFIRTILVVSAPGIDDFLAWLSYA